MALRSILHVDMDAFFAAVEQRDDPALRGKPVLVGHDGPRGVVAAASYEAREYGCHSAQPMAVAKRNCPHAIIVRHRGHAYQEASRVVFDLFHRVTPLVEPLSIDEAFLDVTGSRRLLGSAESIARDLKASIVAETRLTASIGVAPNKFLAKLVSEWDKPDGLTVITAEEAIPRLAPLPLRAMWGVGPAAEERLARLGFRTFGDLQSIDRAEARLRLGADADRLWHLARGIDDRPVHGDGRAKSIGHEQTFGVDLTDPERVLDVLRAQTEQVGVRLRRHELAARTVTIKIRFGDFQTITRSTTLERATDCTTELWDEVRALFRTWQGAGFTPVRLAGVSTSNLGPAGRGQLPLFGAAEHERLERIDAVTDAIVSKYGRGSIGRGVPAPRAGGGDDP